MILKDLEKAKAKRLGNSEEFIDSCKLLLENNQNEERDILKSVGLDTHIREAEMNTELQEKNRRYEEEYKGKIFHISEIKEMCLKYRLYLRKSNQYRGTIPPDLGIILRRFQTDTKVAIAATPDYNQFYIIAPPKYFKGYMTMGERIKDEATDVTIKVKNFLNSLRDPILLYKVDEDHFVLLKKWGNDLNWFRTIPAWFMKTNFRTSLLSIIVLALLLIVPIAIFNHIPENVLATKESPKFTGVLYWILSIFWMLIMIMSLFFYVSNKIYKKVSTQSRWNA